MARLRLFLTSGLTLLLVLTCSKNLLAIDPWAYFHPEQVKAFGCKVTDTALQINGTSRDEMMWEATAFAHREHDDWEQEIGVFPYTLKGRHQAERACTKWQDEAEKRVKASQK